MKIMKATCRQPSKVVSVFSAASLITAFAYFGVAVGATAGFISSGSGVSVRFGSTGFPSAMPSS